MITMMNASLIRVPRSSLDENKIAAHITSIEEGKEPPPLDVREIQKDVFVIDGNGRHRLMAYLRLGILYVPVNITSTQDNEHGSSIC